LINHLLLICNTVFIYEVARFFKTTYLIKLNLKTYKKIINLFKLKNLSDFRKEKLIFCYSKILFGTSIKFLFLIFLIIIFIFFLNFLSLSYYNFIFSISSIIELTIVFVIYHQLRKKSDAKL
jgi:hypothetical protein